MSIAIVWFRSDLRLADNPALTAALAAGHAIIPVHVQDESTDGIRTLGASSRWWLQRSLRSLDAALRLRGSHLLRLHGPAERVIGDLVTTCRADAVYWNRLYDRGSRERDARVKQALEARGVKTLSFKANLLFEPWEVRTKMGQPFQVFTPFWRACRNQADPGSTLDAPIRLPLLPMTLPGDLAAPDASAFDEKTAGFAEHWTPGEAAARDRLAHFLDHALDHYHTRRDHPAVDATSRLSPHLTFGELSPRQIWRAVMARGPSPAADKYLAELGWREFAYNLVFHVGDLDRRNMRSEFDGLPWLDHPELIDVWREGRTGYPIVDAGMRQLHTTGWMHNRVRMIVASFLIKHLLVDWRVGERWFWDRLVDADPANNPVGWQWVAGSGADSAPFFRIFNPVLQGEKFDPDGTYVRHWLPELADLPARSIHRPWAAERSPSLRTYPSPIVDHTTARQRCLAAFAAMRRRTP